MARPSILHRSSLDNIVSLLIDDKSLIGVDAPDVIVLLLSTDNEDLVLGLYGSELCREFVRISNLNALGCLAAEFVNVEFSVNFIEIVQSWSGWSKDEIWLKADHIM